MIKRYNIALKVRGKNNLAYFVGESEEITTSIPACVWSGQSFHVSRTNMAALVFSSIKENAKTIIGNITMKSWLNRIVEQLPYFDVDVDEVRIIVLDDSSHEARINEALKGGEE